MITDYDYDYYTNYDNEFAFTPKKFFTPPALQQSAFLDIFG